jgi:protein-arginine kinase activator protein McsA
MTILTGQDQAVVVVCQECRTRPAQVREIVVDPHVSREITLLCRDCWGEHSCRTAQRFAVNSRLRVTHEVTL